MFKKVIFTILLLISINYGIAEVINDINANKLVASNTIKAKAIIKDNVFRIYPNANINDFYLEKEYGRYTYEITLTDDKGAIRKVVYDGKTGVLLKNDRSQK